MAGQVFFLFCIQVAAGILAILPLVGIDVVGRAFYKINVRTAIAFLLLGHGAYPLLEGLGLLGLALGAAAAIVSLIYLRVLSTARFEKGAPLLWLAAAFALASVGVHAWQAVSSSQYPGNYAWVDGLSLLLGTAMLGSVTLAMILGHYYLNYPKLSIEPLKRYSAALLAASFGRAILFGLCLTLAMTYVPGEDPDRGFLLENGMIIAQRALFGVLGPCLLAVMNWYTVKISSTQSATGILYADMVLVAIGELVAAWFLVTAHMAL